MTELLQLRNQFPGLNGKAHDKPFVYLDHAATTQKALPVIERMDTFLREEYGTVHRGMYQRSVRSTELYEEARKDIASFFHTKAQNIVYTMGCTDAINLVAWSYGRKFLKKNDVVLISEMEHHANIVPWQLIGEITGSRLIACPVLDDGSLDEEAFTKILKDEPVKIVSLVHVSNALGTINPVERLIPLAHEAGAKVLLDGAQSAPHMPVNLEELDCDWFTCSSHKLYGPTGIGILYGKTEVLESMPPWRGGGEMIDQVSFDGTTFAPPPGRFEAGTPPITEAIGFAAACKWLSNIGMDKVHQHEAQLYSYLEEKISEVPGLTRMGMAPQRAGLISFTMQEAHASDISSILDMNGIAIRAGHHCAQPIMKRFGVPATARISLGVSTNTEDIDAAIAGLHKVADLFGLI